MDPYAFPGLVGGIAGTWLFLLGFLVSAGGAIRVAFVLRRPGKGRVARGLVAGGGLVGLAGIALFWGAQASPWKASFDRAAPLVALVATVLGALLTRAVARRVARTPTPRGGPRNG